ncbi:hypothetical protein D9758_007574 [Tetrapyrgos nigripes]|uniref:Mediator of RNA polymerase II transcription subunit 21 n=1 Tax=Tetrapyrgos nigripes TaxID=182062 RepID=A0A8H5LK43_9AGAR|nr:hypothetical protein D9758_007574 [Tetrapyrgos nigripes]
MDHEIQNLLMIMSNSIAYLTSRANFLEISPEIPVTKQRNPEKYDTPEVFEGVFVVAWMRYGTPLVDMLTSLHDSENKKELVTDLVRKAKQIEYLISSLPEPESEEEQAGRLQSLEEEMQAANVQYIAAVNRAKTLHAQISDLLHTMLTEVDTDLV